MPDPVAEKSLLAGCIKFDRMPAHLGGHPGHQGLVKGVLFVAETPADVRLDDPDLAPGHAQGLTHDPPDQVGDLG